MMISEFGIILTIYLGLLLLLIFIGVPVGFSMGITSIVMMILPYGPDLNTVSLATSLFRSMNSFVFLAFPFYLMLGRIMNSIGLTESIFEFANSLLGHIRGGLAYVNIVASIIFSGMSGLATADVAGLGRIEYSAMRDFGYEKDISIGVTGASAVIGPIMPPSVIMIVYAILAEESIGAMFLGGVIPALLISMSLMLFTYIQVFRKEQYITSEGFNIRSVISTGATSLPAIMIPVFIITGIIGGYFTATEAGAISVIYAIALGMFYYDTLGWKDVLREARDSMVETFALTFIIANATIYGLVALQLRIPILLTDAIVGFTTNAQVIMVLMVIAMLIIGTFMEKISAVSLLVPILIPAIGPLGIDPIHFGVVMISTLMIGSITPPMGGALYALEKVTDATLEEILYAIWPYYVPMVIACFILALIPELVTWVPYTLMG